MGILLLVKKVREHEKSIVFHVFVLFLPCFLIDFMAKEQRSNRLFVCDAVIQERLKKTKMLVGWHHIFAHERFFSTNT